MIVVEGPDGAGKTSLIEKLRDITGLGVAPRVVNERAEAMTDLVKWTEINVSQGWHPQIYDRHRLISEPIYGTILRSDPEPGFDDLSWIQRQISLFHACEPIVVVCLPPIHHVVENVMGDAKDKDRRNLVVENDIEKIYWMYHYLLGNHPDYIHYDYTTDPQDTRTAAIAGVINTQLRMRGFRNE